MVAALLQAPQARFSEVEMEAVMDAVADLKMK
jgi:hypothetical protein